MKIKQTFKGDGLFLMFGFMLAMSSSVGQTYFLGVYKPAIQQNYSLSETDFGFMYFGLTLAGAVILNRIGHLIDTVPLQKYTLSLCALMVTACLFVAVSPGIIILFFALLMTRLVGQGLMTHAAMTSMSRYFTRRRGLAVSFASLGMPVGQSLLPPLAVFLMVSFSWQASWALIALLYACVLAPVTLFFLRGHTQRHAAWLAAQQDEEAANTSGFVTKHLKRRDVLRDKRLPLLFTVTLACPFWITAIFFFAQNMAEMKGWTLQVFTGLYWMNALGAMTVPLIGGMIVDRVGGLAAAALYPPLLAISICFLIFGDTMLAVGVGLAFLGVAGGLSIPVNTTIWAELYGTRHLGEIKSLSTSVMVFSTALAPYVLGMLLDAGIRLETILMGGVVHGMVATVIAFFMPRFAKA
ncbi:MFS transporter [Kordiimonas sediminis]|uniref:MFS transporter n=1 Tax=Kordiimonas sediminis TaxID=1735581 RepID=A0A919AN73_9PROT|nr:MFS transporter [Kordiimonas sediminis]GHF15995.1 MFS transporter [Kordiimonas sediminis]